MRKCLCVEHVVGRCYELIYEKKKKKNVQMCAFVQECMLTLVLIRLVQFLVLDVSFALVCDVVAF